MSGGTAALGIGGLIAAAWYIAVELRNPHYLYYYFIDRHLKGFPTGTQRHGHAPWWYYLPILVAGGSPWIAYLPVVVQDQWIKRGKGDWLHLPERPGGCAAQMVPVPFFPGAAPAGSSGGQGDAMLLLGCWLLGGTLLLSHRAFEAGNLPVAGLSRRGHSGGGRLGEAVEGTLSPRARRLLGGVFWMTCLVGPATLPACCWWPSRNSAPGGCRRAFGRPCW